MIYLWYFTGLGTTLLIKFLRRSYKKPQTLAEAAVEKPQTLAEAAVEWFIGSPESSTTSVTYVAVAGVLCAWYTGAITFGGEPQGILTVHPVMALCLGSLCELVVPPVTMRIVTTITSAMGAKK